MGTRQAVSLKILRIEYVVARMMVETLDQTTVDRILNGKRDREVKRFHSG
jgi:hypothetical protein